MTRQKNIKLIIFLLLIVTILGEAQWLNIDVNSTYVFWVAQGWLLYLFYRYRNIVDTKLDLFIQIFLVWVFITSIRSIFIAELYWDWKNVVEKTFIMFLPLSIYFSHDPRALSYVIRKWTFWGIILFVLFVPFMQPEAIGKHLVPISFLALFFPALTFRQKMYVIFLSSSIFVLGSLGARSSVIKFLIPVIFSFIYYSRNALLPRLYWIAWNILILFPILFFILGLTGVFNIFKIEEYLKVDRIEVTNSFNREESESLLGDTRTFLYVEVIKNAVDDNSVLIMGNSFGKGRKSESFGYYFLELTKTYRIERMADEVSILNVFSWMGLIGVLLYGAVFIRASFNAIKKSGNVFMKIIGLYVAFRWAYAWVEDFNRFDLNYIFLWILIGMCFSKSLLAMNDREMVKWCRSCIFIK